MDFASLFFCFVGIVAMRPRKWGSIRLKSTIREESSCSSSITDHNIKFCRSGSGSGGGGVSGGKLLNIKSCISL